ncbi:binder of sperm protein-like protein 1 [Rhinolophus ferrumequinum]|uniref:Binder of sperm protein-like protein 1 n=1 Tax=Rhinolophus ferrumequinum TaxID=59479 RepID=A0A7J7SGU4_RHIFE|nr:binder of sperm protein homolog 1-like [Rhinolophus ferrumequinum]KAF6287598.1 binder of sperm protein-like protein 1 [Rhinolophus ferrumequinum]
MPLHVGLLLVWVCWCLSVVGQLLEGDKCFFPFYYKNAIHHDCIKFKAKQKWCSLNETYNGYWKYCSEGDFAKCVFPFWYRRMIYWECTNDAETFGKNWCSLTQNYNKEKIWKYCD